GPLNDYGCVCSCPGINECSQVPQPCGPNALCIDTARGFTCMCEPGYRSSKGDSWLPRSVAPLDCSGESQWEAEGVLPAGLSCPQTVMEGLPAHTSPLAQLCVRCPPGPAHCPVPNTHRDGLCRAGSSPSMKARGPAITGKEIWGENIDECSQDPSPCGPDSICTNTLGSYTCRCRAGYLPPRQPGAPFSCTEINECSQVPQPCGPNALCIDTARGFTCMCEPGYRSSKGDSWLPRSVAPLDCSDIDECSRDPSPCGPDSICSNTPGSYTCRCQSGYLPPSQPGAPFSCTEVTSKCRAHFLGENDLQTSSNVQGAGVRWAAAYCTLLKSTFRALAEPCEEKNSAVCLEKAAGGFASILKQTSSWSNLSTEQLSILATIILHNVERIVMDVVTNPTENGNLTLRTEQLDVQTKVISDGCSREDSVVSLGAKGEIMEIGCKTVQGSTAKGAAGVVFASYVGMETIMNGSFFQDQKAASSHAIRMISRVVSAWLTSQTKTNFTDPVNYTFQHIMPHNPSEKPTCVSWETTAQNGSWSPAGCRVLRSNATHTTCSCDHVSSLAVLMAWGE
uniref:Adhesion G protein-coupled receptor E1 n=1 Tax=Pelodiscus sinensis TaxID=13735 RepID=K7GDD9_PELSI